MKWGLQLGGKFSDYFYHRASLYVSLNTTGCHNNILVIDHMCVCTCCVEEQQCHLCVLYEGCVFLCTDWEAPELSVFAIS